MDTVPQPWLKYNTVVVPNGGLTFENASDGWMVEGQTAYPIIDSFLASTDTSTQQSQVAWPGNVVVSTTDGGSTWSQSLSVPDGIWGLDFLAGSSTGWAVGVDQLYETSNGGSTWSLESEPTDTALVDVSFSSTTDGIGLTTAGALVFTDNGGANWGASQTLADPIVSSCATGTDSYLLADLAGDIWTVTSGGSDTQVFTSPLQPTHGSAVLTCSNGSFYESLSIAGPNPAAAGGYAVLDASQPAGPWTAVINSGNALPTSLNAPDASVIASDYLGAFAAYETNLVAADYGSDGTLNLQYANSTSTSSTGSSGASASTSNPEASNSVATSSISGLPTAPSKIMPEISKITGIAEIAGGSAWISVVTQVSSSSEVDRRVYASTNGGSTWTLASDTSAPAPSPGS
ncbi:MAG TPA: hypothetical protein VME22_15680 [Solirubrobacteraceae bacterium]|nr:hypothetical protein [Solirubrobacteraceae bacterium]